MAPVAPAGPVPEAGHVAGDRHRRPAPTRVGGVTTPPPSGSSFGLGQDHLDLRDWVHTFAAEVVRPAAAE